MCVCVHNSEQSKAKHKKRGLVSRPCSFIAVVSNRCRMCVYMTFRIWWWNITWNKTYLFAQDLCVREWILSVLFAWNDPKFNTSDEHTNSKHSFGQLSNSFRYCSKQCRILNPEHSPTYQRQFLCSLCNFFSHFYAPCWLWKISESVVRHHIVFYLHSHTPFPCHCTVHQSIVWFKKSIQCIGNFSTTVRIHLTKRTTKTTKHCHQPKLLCIRVYLYRHLRFVVIFDNFQRPIVTIWTLGIQFE